MRAPALSSAIGHFLLIVEIRSGHHALAAGRWFKQVVPSDIDQAAADKGSGCGPA